MCDYLIAMTNAIDTFQMRVMKWRRMYDRKRLCILSRMHTNNDMYEREMPTLFDVLVHFRVSPFAGVTLLNRECASRNMMHIFCLLVLVYSNFVEGRENV